MGQGKYNLSDVVPEDNNQIDSYSVSDFKPQGKYYIPNMPLDQSNQIGSQKKPGYMQMTWDRLVDIGKGFVDAWKRGDLPAMTGISALEQQYKPDNIPNPLKDLPSTLVHMIPFIGPGANEAIRKISYGTDSGDEQQAKEGYAQLTTDVIIPMLMAKGGDFGVKIGSKTRTAVSNILKESANKNYMDVLLPSAKRDVPLAERVAQQMAERKMTAASRKGLQTKIQASKAEWGPKAATAFEGAEPIPLTQAQVAIDAIKEKHVYVKGTSTVPENRAGLNNFLEQAKNDISGLVDENGNIPAQILDNYVDDINKGLVGANKNYATELPPKSAKFIQQRTAGALRTILDLPNPKAAQINATYSMYANIDKFLENTRRSTITSKSGLVTGSSKGFGAMVERNLPKPVRGIPRAITGIFDSVPWNTVSGATKQRIAEFLASGNFTAAEILMKKLEKASTVPAVFAIGQNNTNQ